MMKKIKSSVILLLLVNCFSNIYAQTSNQQLAKQLVNQFRIITNFISTGGIIRKDVKNQVKTLERNTFKNGAIIYEPNFSQRNLSLYNYLLFVHRKKKAFDFTIVNVKSLSSQTLKVVTNRYNIYIDLYLRRIYRVLVPKIPDNSKSIIMVDGVRYYRGDYVKRIVDSLTYQIDSLKILVKNLQVKAKNSQTTKKQRDSLQSILDKYNFFLKESQKTAIAEVKKEVRYRLNQFKIRVAIPRRTREKESIEQSNERIDNYNNTIYINKVKKYIFCEKDGNGNINDTITIHTEEGELKEPLQQLRYYLHTPGNKPYVELTQWKVKRIITDVFGKKHYQDVDESNDTFNFSNQIKEKIQKEEFKLYDLHIEIRTNEN